MNQTKRERREIWVMTIIMLLLQLPNLTSYYYSVGAIPNFINKISMALSLCILHYVSFRELRKPNRYLFVFIFIWMTFISLFNLTPSMPYMTLFIIALLMVSGVLSRPFDLRNVGESFFYLSIFFLPFLIWQVLKADLDMSTILRRGLSWTEVFAWAAITNFWPICLFSAFLLKDRHLLIAAFVIMLMSVVMNSLSLKRAVYVDVAAVVILIAFVSWRLKDKQTLKYILSAIVPFVILGAFFLYSSGIDGEVTEVTNAIFNRFSKSSEDVSSFDRLDEARHWLNNEAGFFDVVLGTGFFSSHHGLEDEHYYLHLGWMNLIFKGGLILFFSFFYMQLKALRIILSPRRYSKETLFSAMICVFYFFNFFYSNAMGFGPELFFLFYSLMQVNNPPFRKQVNGNIIPTLSGSTAQE